MWQQLRATDFIIFALGIWLAILSFYLIKTGLRWRKITGWAANQNLEKILENILEKQKLEAKQLAGFSAAIERIQRQQTTFFVKHALIRYNPFEDTGGDQSFALALLDGANSGVVVSSLHSRTGTRVYAKQVLNGKPTNHQFSKEEKEVVEKAARHVLGGTT